MTYPHCKADAVFERVLILLPFDSTRTKVDPDALHELVKKPRTEQAPGPVFRDYFSCMCDELCRFFNRKSLDIQHGAGTCMGLSKLFIYYQYHPDTLNFHRSQHTYNYLCSRAADIVELLAEASLLLFPFRPAPSFLRMRVIPLDCNRPNALFQALGHARSCYLLSLLSLFAAEQKSELIVMETRFSMSKQGDDFEEQGGGDEQARLQAMAIEPCDLEASVELRAAEYALDYVSLALRRLQARDETCSFKSREEVDSLVTKLVNFTALFLSACFKLVGRQSILDMQAHRLVVGLLRVANVTTGRFCASASQQGEYEDHTARNFAAQLLNLSALLRQGVLAESVLVQGKIDLEAIRTGTRNAHSLLQIGACLLLQLSDSAVFHVDAVTLSSGAAPLRLFYASYVQPASLSEGVDHRIAFDALAPELYPLVYQAALTQGQGSGQEEQDPVALFMI